MLHLLFEWSTILPSYFWLEILEGKWVSLLVTILTLGTLPLLLLSFGCLHLYYTRFHPWRSEGVSLGFEPQDKEVWRPLIPESRGKIFTEVYLHHQIMFLISGEASWGTGVWHEHDLKDTWISIIPSINFINIIVHLARIHFHQNCFVFAWSSAKICSILVNKSV